MDQSLNHEVHDEVEEDVQNEKNENSIEDENIIAEDITNVEEEESNEELNAPKIGMIFDTEDDLFLQYLAYSKRKGFEIVKARTKRCNGEVKYVTFACARSGKPRQKSDNSIKSKPMKKGFCGAKVNVKLCSDGKWKVSSIVLKHNHEMSPSNSRFFPRNRIINLDAKRRLFVNDRAGIGIAKTFNAEVVQAGGHENVSFLEKDARNEVAKERRLRLKEGDATAVLNYFSKMQSINSKFFYLMDIDDECRLKNIFWADERSRLAYEEFGDVVTFDTTYLTNKYDMPFAPFVGVNHHGQSILLGCGLISREDTESFTWLFRSWLACMGGVAPSGIITDQDMAMQNAIKIVFPQTRHRWCLWHIMKKVPEKFKSCNNYELISNAISACVYDSTLPTEFEMHWHTMIENFGFEKNEWLLGLYKERHRWVPTFVKDTFWAGMSTTQRSESMNAFFDGYVHSKTTLKQFVEQYENALRSKVEKEKQEDFKCSNTSVPLFGPYPMEKQIHDVYTRAKFWEFQNEMKSLVGCKVCSSQQQGSVLECNVREDILIGEYTKRTHFTVWLVQGASRDEIEVKCTCRLFEFRGIVCKHSLAVLFDNGIHTLPDTYILRRWRKDIKRRHTKIAVNFDSQTNTVEWCRYDKMSKAFQEVKELAMRDDESCDMVLNWIKNLTIDLKKFKKGNEGDHHINNVQSESRKIRSPVQIRKKGRPPFKRKQSTTEKMSKRASNRKKNDRDTSLDEKRARKAGQRTKDRFGVGNMVQGQVLEASNTDLSMIDNCQQPCNAFSYEGLVLPYSQGSYSSDVFYSESHMPNTDPDVHNVNHSELFVDPVEAIHAQQEQSQGSDICFGSLQAGQQS